MAWADFDNDGRMDFLLTGATSPSTRVSQLWRNTGNGFTNISIGVPALIEGSVACADYDNDGRVDFLLTGHDGPTLVSQLWRNLFPLANTPPPSPSGLTTSVSNGLATLRWTASADTESGTNLTYNLRVGAVPGGGDILAPHADTADGFRRLPAFGNAQLGTEAQLDLAPGIYYWSVQAVDTAFAGGPFAPEGSFTVPGPRLSIAQSGADALLSWPAHAGDLALYAATTLSPSATWAAVTNAPVFSNAAWRVAVPAMAHRFFRLQSE